MGIPLKHKGVAILIPFHRSCINKFSITVRYRPSAEYPHRVRLAVLTVVLTSSGTRCVLAVGLDNSADARA